MPNEPLLIISSTVKVLRTKTIFHQEDQMTVINAPGTLMGEVVTLCDGSRTRVQIVGSLSSVWDEDCVNALIDELLRFELLVDVKYVCKRVWQCIKNPSPYARPISDQEVAELVVNAWQRQKTSLVDMYYPRSTFGFGSLIENRHSTRNFSDVPVSLQAVVDILWSAYGECRSGKRTVPSAGALYPVVLYLALMRPSRELSSGIYRVDLSQMWSVGFELVSNDIGAFQRAFLDPLMVERAHGVVVVGGSLQITSEKYGNRSMLYVPIEVGHVAQNVHLAAYAHSLATVEIGGFTEDTLRKAVGMSDEYSPMTTVLFGHASCDAWNSENIEGVDVEWVVPAVRSYQAPFAIAQARVSSGLCEDWSYGRDASPSMALTKAVSEAKEWASCGFVPENLLKARMCDVADAIDPKTIVSFHETQYLLPEFPLTPFNEELAYEWVEGKDLISGKSKYLLAELVYFPYFGDNPPYLFANSSGVAAHPILEKAIESSTLELIERDSFMIAYFSGLQFPSILVSSLPLYLQQRINALEQEGFRVTIKDHTLDLAPVVSVFVQNEIMGYTNCASCSRFDVESALDHALMEVEASVLAVLQNGTGALLKPQDVSMPLHHGALYEQKRYYRKADFMLGGDMRRLQECRAPLRNWDALLCHLQKIETPLVTTQFFLPEQCGGNGNLHIVRSVVPGLVPMTFGHRQEPGGMK